jgi:hypothetical protein
MRDYDPGRPHYDFGRELAETLRIAIPPENLQCHVLAVDMTLTAKRRAHGLEGSAHA